MSCRSLLHGIRAQLDVLDAVEEVTRWIRDEDFRAGESDEVIQLLDEWYQPRAGGHSVYRERRS